MDPHGRGICYGESGELEMSVNNVGPFARRLNEQSLERASPFWVHNYRGYTGVHAMGTKIGVV